MYTQVIEVKFVIPPTNATGICHTFLIGQKLCFMLIIPITLGMDSIKNISSFYYLGLTPPFPPPPRPVRP